MPGCQWMVRMAPQALVPYLVAGMSSSMLRCELKSWSGMSAVFSSSRGFSAKAAGGLLAMANVSKRNFGEAYEQLKGYLQKADFVAIDLEMTGVESTMWRRNLEMDTCETRYQNLKHSAEKFAVWQCGVCPFRWDESGKKFIAFPFNFSIFPRNELELDMPSRAFFAQTSSLEFLAKHKFDFNTCVYDGISYLSRDQEAAARSQLGLGLGPGCHVKKQNFTVEPEIPLTRSTDVLFVERIREQVGKWRDGLLSRQPKLHLTHGAGSSGVSVAKLDSIPLPLDPTKEDPILPQQEIAVSSGFSSMRPTLVLNSMSPFQSKLVKQLLSKDFDDLVGVVKQKGSAGTTTGNRSQSQVQVIYTTSMEDKNQLLEELAEEEKQLLELSVSEAVGFRKVIDAISESGLPVIGHNCILDMMHVHNDFRRYGGSKDTGLKHEAGFDAYMTGAVFAQACHLLQIDVSTIRNLPQAVKDGDAGLASFVNLLALGWVGNMALDLASGKEATGVKAFRGPHPPANRHSSNSTVVLVWGFPAGSEEHDLRRIVQDVFKQDRPGPPLDVILVDKSAAFIKFREPAVMQQFFQLIQDQKTASTYPTISPDLRAAPYEAYECLCKSPLSTELLADSAHILGLGHHFSQGSEIHNDSFYDNVPALPRSQEHFEAEIIPSAMSQENSDMRHDIGLEEEKEIGSDLSVAFNSSEGAADHLREEIMLEISDDVENRLDLGNIEETSNGDRRLLINNSENQETGQQATSGSDLGIARDRKDACTVELSCNSWTKQSFSEDQAVFISPNFTKHT
ncbi:hypothetical protein CY35_10G087300 [Sphagnum magellanicum]|nr:hypothetical protein CY35_10G087300 [Sphagnum magellanicum]